MKIILIIFLSVFSVSSLLTAHENKSIALSIDSGYAFAYGNLSNYFFIDGNIQYHFSNHWGIKPEIYCLRLGDEFFIFPFLGVIYTFTNFKKSELFPYFSFSTGGWIEPKEEFGIILNKIEVGSKYYVIHNSDWGLALNLGLSSIHPLLFYPGWFSLYIGIQLCIFD